MLGLSTVLATGLATAQVRIYLYARDVDMRKSFNGLCAIVQSEFKTDIRLGDLFLFLNRRNDRVKLMYWDRDGIAIWMKRLESGTFQRPMLKADQHPVEFVMKKQAMQTMKIIFLFFMIYILISTSAFCTSRYSTHMQEAIEIPNDLEACKGLISQQSATIATQFSQLQELTIEMEKLRKLLVRLLNGNRSEKHIVTSDKQSMLPFENEEELQAAKAEAEAQAESIIQKYTVEREIKKKRRSEALPSHLPRIEITVEVPESMKECPEHGRRTIIDYDVTEKLVHEPAKLFVEVRRYPKFACPKHSQCGLASPERPTGLVEGDKYDSSVAAAIIEAKWFNYMPIYRQQDIFAGSGWTPARSTLLNIVMQSAFVLAPLYEYMKKLVQGDIAVGIDDTGCRMLLPAEIPVAKAGDAKS